MAKTTASVQARKLIPAGIAGAATVEGISLCIASLGLMLLNDLAIAMLHWGALCVLMGSVAGLLTSRLWRSESRAVAYRLGLVGIIGSFSALFWLQVYLMKRPYLLDLDKLNDLQRLVLFDSVTITAAIFTQVFVLLILLALRASLHLAQRTMPKT